MSKFIGGQFYTVRIPVTVVYGAGQVAKLEAEVELLANSPGEAATALARAVQEFVGVRETQTGLATGMLEQCAVCGRIMPPQALRAHIEGGGCR